MEIEMMHEGFKHRLESSQHAVDLAVELLRIAGHDAQAKPHTVAEKYEDRHLHSDSGDIALVTDAGDERIVEVKHLGVNFTGMENWPFGRHVIVDGKNTFDGKKVSPYAYIDIAKNCKHYLVIFGHTMPLWYVRERFDRNTQRMENFYMIDKYLCIFRAIPRGLC